MEVYKIDITSWTASFRYPNLISGMQPTLEVPPISTILGLINAAAGYYIKHKSLQIGYYFEYEMEGEDLESIYQIGSESDKKAKINILKRKFLYNNFLRIYTPDEEIAGYLYQPHFQLLLGRVNDLATVINISKKEFLKEILSSTEIRGQIIPFRFHLPGQIQALPQYFTNELPRKNIGTEPFSIISHKSNTLETTVTAYRDLLPNGKNVDIFFHQISF